MEYKECDECGQEVTSWNFYDGFIICDDCFPGCFVELMEEGERILEEIKSRQLKKRS